MWPSSRLSVLGSFQELLCDLSVLEFRNNMPENVSTFIYCTENLFLKSWKIFLYCFTADVSPLFCFFLFYLFEMPATCVLNLLDESSNFLKKFFSYFWNVCFFVLLFERFLQVYIVLYFLLCFQKSFVLRIFSFCSPFIAKKS